MDLRPNLSLAIAQPSRPPAVAAPTAVTNVVANAGVTMSGSWVAHISDT